VHVQIDKEYSGMRFLAINFPKNQFLF